MLFGVDEVLEHIVSFIDGTAHAFFIESFIKATSSSVPDIVADLTHFVEPAVERLVRRQSLLADALSEQVGLYFDGSPTLGQPNLEQFVLLCEAASQSFANARKWIEFGQERAGMLQDYILRDVGAAHQVAVLMASDIRKDQLLEALEFAGFNVDRYLGGELLSSAVFDGRCMGYIAGASTDSLRKLVRELARQRNLRVDMVNAILDANDVTSA